MKKKRKKVNIRTLCVGDDKHHDNLCPELYAQIEKQKLDAPKYVILNGALTRREDIQDRD